MRPIVLALALCAACAAQPKGPAVTPPPPASQPTGGADPIQKAGTKGKSKEARVPTAAEAKAFAARAEKELLRLWIASERASWVKSTYITFDTALQSAQAHERMMARTAALAAGAARFVKVELDPVTRRKLRLIKLSLSLPAPPDAKQRAELARIATKLEGIYGRGRVCSKKLAREWGRLTKTKRSKLPKDSCLSLGQLGTLLKKSRKYDVLLEVWSKWRAVSVPMRKDFARYVALGNAGARSLGFANLGDLWKSRYDMKPADFEVEIDRLWGQVKPLYDDLHCYVRSRLQKRYGKKRVADGKPIPAHLLGNMWSQAWSGLAKDLLPEPRRGTVSIEKALARKKVDERGMVRFGEAFFVSLGLAKLPATFWKRSMFKKPRDRDVVCHASAWDVNWIDDLRIKMCIDINDEHFRVIHHELGHNYYQYYYRQQPALFRDSANDGFHEGLGDTIALSVTPSYLKRIGLLRRAPKGDLNMLMKRALDKIAFLPFGIMIDKWRWDVFAGKVKPGDYNAAWWALRTKYQGIAAPVTRSESDFDPGAKYHIAGNVPYVRYFLAHILQFQFHRALCKAAGYEGPLHKCSIYGNKKAGGMLEKMMKMGLSRPWPEALSVITGTKRMDATALLDYFKPLHTWLKKQNKGKRCGW